MTKETLPSSPKFVALSTLSSGEDLEKEEHEEKLLEQHDEQQQQTWNKNIADLDVEGVAEATSSSPFYFPTPSEFRHSSATGVLFVLLLALIVSAAVVFHVGSVFGLTPLVISALIVAVVSVGAMIIFWLARYEVDLLQNGIRGRVVSTLFFVAILGFGISTFFTVVLPPSPCCQNDSIPYQCQFKPWARYCKTDHCRFEFFMKMLYFSVTIQAIILGMMLTFGIRGLLFDYFTPLSPEEKQQQWGLGKYASPYCVLLSIFGVVAAVCVLGAICSTVMGGMCGMAHM